MIHRLFAWLLISTVIGVVMAKNTATFSSEDPPDKIVRVFLVVPSDIPDPGDEYPTGIANVMKESQNYFMEQCGFTFRLNDPVCEVLKSDKTHAWFSTPDDYWTIVFNATDEVYRMLPSVDADGKRARWKIVIYGLAESPADGGGGGGGWVGLPKHDADGAAIYPKEKARWCGGMSHELGHCFGLPDATHDDGTVMSADFYHWPVNCIFTKSQTNTMKNLRENEGFWTTDITETNQYQDFTVKNVFSQKWSPVIRGNRIYVPLLATSVFGASIGIYNLSGRRAAYFSPTATESGSSLHSFDIGGLPTGNYICSLEKNGKIVQTKVLKKFAETMK